MSDEAIVERRGPLREGEVLKYGLSIGSNDLWTKLDVEVTCGADESAADVWKRAQNLVDNLLIRHTAELKQQLKK